MEQIGSLTKKKSVLSGVAEATLVCHLAEKAIKKFLPSPTPTSQLSFSAGRLKVGIRGASNAQELKLLQGKIVSTVNEKLGEEKVREVSVRTL